MGCQRCSQSSCGVRKLLATRAPFLGCEAHLQRIGTATPRHNIHEAFVQFAHGLLQEERARSLFLRMAERAEIRNRYSVLSVSGKAEDKDVDANAFYRRGRFPSTAERMRVYERCAPVLMRDALDALALSEKERRRIRHVVVTSCTGLYAPGLDFAAVEYLGLSSSTERTMIGFMGCYAAINALKQARHIVRSQPEEDVLVLNLELCTLHLQETQDLNEVLSFLLFADGCSASLISSESAGLRLDSFHALHLQDTEDLITWRIADQGFDMVLSGQVPAAIGRALKHHAAEWNDLGDQPLWAVHPGGRSVLDAVEEGLDLPAKFLRASRDVLERFGNMSSATIMFVLQQIMREAQPGQAGVAMSFGPGLMA